MVRLHIKFLQPSRFAITVLPPCSLPQAAVKASKAFYSSKVAPGSQLPRLAGNMYCASVYGSLASLLATKGAELVRDLQRSGRM